MDNKLVMALIIVVLLDVLFFLSQTAITNVNPDGTSIYDYDNSMLKEFDAGNYTLLNANATTNFLPEGTDSISTEGDNVFTDTFKTTSTWTKTLSKGLDYFIRITSGPVNYMKVIHAPQEVTYSVGVLWYIITLFLFIGFLLGK